MLRLRLLHILLFIGLITAIKKEYGTDGFELQCLPSKTLFFWHVDDRDDDSFYQQRRLIVTLIGNLTEQTIVSVITVGAETNLEITFIKENTNSSWRDSLMNLNQGNSWIHSISSIKIRDAIFNYFDNKVKAEMAEEVVLIVNHNSVIDDEEKTLVVLEQKKTSIVFYGNWSDERIKMWMNIATDKRHFYMLDDKQEHINKTVKSILITTCQDSKFFCDNDQFWNGRRCYRCTDICSKKRPTEYCLRACPYFNHVMFGTERVELEDGGVTTRTNANTSFVTTFGHTLLSVILFILLLTFVGLAYKFRNRFIPLCKRSRRKYPVSKKRIPLTVTDDTDDEESGLNKNGKAHGSEESVPLLVTFDTCTNDDEFEHNENGTAQASKESMPFMATYDNNFVEFDLYRRTPASRESVPILVTDNANHEEFEFCGNRRLQSSKRNNEENHQSETTDSQTQTYNSINEHLDTDSGVDKIKPPVSSNLGINYPKFSEYSSDMEIECFS